MRRAALFLALLVMLLPCLASAVTEDQVSEAALEAIQDSPPAGKRFDHNTVSVVGFPIKELDRHLTGKWYCVLPVDLSRDGTERVQLAVANQYYFGYAYVTVEGDEVTVTIAYPNGRMTAEEECIALFAGWSDLTAEYLEDPVGNMVSGAPVSITESLDGAEEALLFIRNTVSFRQPFYSDRVKLRRWWRGTEDWKAYLAEKRELLNRLMER